MERNLEEANLDSILRGVQLGHFIILSIPISQQLPRLTSLDFLSFLKWPLILNCTLPWQQSSAVEHWSSPENWHFFSIKYKIPNNTEINFANNSRDSNFKSCYCVQIYNESDIEKNWTKNHVSASDFWNGWWIRYLDDSSVALMHMEKLLNDLFPISKPRQPFFLLFCVCSLKRN